MSDTGGAARALSAVVFDLDGTLVESRHDIVAAVEFALSAHGVRPLGADVIAGFVGDGARLLVARALGRDGNDPEVEPVLATFLDYYAAHPVERTELMPFAVEALDALASLPLAVCTNKPRHIADLVLEGLGLSRRFATVVGGGDTAKHKPDPEPLRVIAERLGVPAENVAMVGDGVQDIVCGRSAGAYTVAVLGGFAGEAVLRSSDPDLVIPSLDALPTALFRGRRPRTPS